jgi:Rieske Fe-S protein
MGNKAPDPGMNRRQFILLAAASAAAGNLRPADAGVAGEQLIDAGPLRAYSADGLYEGYRDVGFFIIRKGDKLIALSSNCTHRKCKLKAEKDHSFYCKCHGSTFDPNGKVTEGPATRDLPAFPTKIEKGHLFVVV